ncbi:hypothetical protein ACFSJY_11990 [Thalassotalea euphylliae]|uniref:hypothetical protein n=1 Tax=Thalassotalea euphylliae TaxID=1655234 RepID=UPI00363B7F23
MPSITKLLLFVITLATPTFTMAGELSGLMMIFLPGFVFLVCGVVAVTYALTSSIEHYWLKTSIRFFVVLLVVTPSHISGSAAWWPNGIAIFFDDTVNVINAFACTSGLTLIMLFSWWLLKKQRKV